MSVVKGSSPLARGLRAHGSSLDFFPRIIPARAGFTGSENYSQGNDRDHPRSRGVYDVLDNVVGLVLGSSPLARGLPRSHVGELPAGGIIPARAGFTRTARTRPRSSWDHPRSRGVYRRGTRTRSLALGSSPLARGLLRSIQTCQQSLGIIPARAGFTSRFHGRPSHTGDHPRSRGVYRARNRLRADRPGSSPLARGLPSSQPPTCRSSRIIPARAGFTIGEAPGIEVFTDHPRSRGVYVGRLGPRRRGRGSSPLARGLPSSQPPTCRSSRIIPARAGFTIGEAPGIEVFTDHPRSRGVYVGRLGPRRRGRGSSPLARGLHHVFTGCRESTGIIPARAGFTRGPCRHQPGGRDHPRSRGVYPRTVGYGRPATRIIPARAGFT